MKNLNIRPSLFVVPISLMLVFGITMWISRQQTRAEEERKDLKISDGLQEIKISFALGNEFEVSSISNLSANIVLKATELSEEEDILLPLAATKVLESFRVADLEFPPLEESSFNIVDNSDKDSIEVYLLNVYNIFSRNVVDISLESALEQLRSGDKKYVEDLIKINENLYLDLLQSPVPKDAIPIHKGYLRFSQIQYHFLVSISKMIQDPLRVTIDTELVSLTLSVINNSIRQDLRILGNQYQLQFDRDI